MSDKQPASIQDETSVSQTSASEVLSEANLQSLVECVGPLLQRGGRTLAYQLPIASRIGHLTLEPFCLYNLFGESHDNIAVITYDRRLHKYSSGVQRLHEPQITFIETMKRKLVALGHLDAGIIEFGTLSWALTSMTALMRDFVKQMEAGKPIRHLTAPPDLLEEGASLLASMGYGDGRPSVVLHVRDKQFLPDQTHNFFRTANIADYGPAIDYLVQRGYRVFRIGDPTSTRLEHENPLVVDLPHHPDYSDLLDVYCMATARFAVTSASGPEAIARVLNTPMVQVNGYAQHDHWVNPDDILLFKTYRNGSTGALLSYDEILGRDLFTENTVAAFDRAGVALEDNSPADILAAVMEMDARIEGRLEQDCELHDRFHDISRQHLDRYRANLANTEKRPPNRIETYAYALPWTRYSQSFMQANPWFLR